MGIIYIRNHRQICMYNLCGVYFIPSFLPHKHQIQTQSHPDLMVDVILMLVPAALHFGQERPSSPGVVGIHIRVKAAAQTADYLRLVENTLNRYTRKKSQKTHHH